MILTASGYSGGGAFILPSCSRRCGGAFLFSLPCTVWRSLRLSTAFFFPGIYFHSLLRFFPCAPRVAFVGVSVPLSPLALRSWRVYTPLSRRPGMHIAAPHCSPCRAAAGFMDGVPVNPATAPEGATPQAVPVSGCKTPPISIPGTGGEFLPEPATKSLWVKSRPRQPFSRPAGLNYSRSSSADNSVIFLLIDSFFCAATKSLNSFAANSHL